MAARKRASSDASTRPPAAETQQKTQATTANSRDAQIAPSKAGQILTFSNLFVPYFYLIFSHYKIEADLKSSILINALLSCAGFFATLTMIPVASRYVLRRNLFGYDINKKGTPQGSIKWLVEYNAALASICFMILLGFVDDVLDVPWRVKLLLPSIAAVPLLMAYAGHTTIVIPKPLIPYVGLEVLDLGWIYKLYMGLSAVFCTNSINIHAGINGLEVGQTVVMASA
ncbi:hypothetical protein F0562_015565 [Nyssa sinensis]|uniref:UDP-N-acetylglucosamine--dolichyl-phosphate N-acetylglucosaminephosphotransferase n=1 Tax=Nyssa sinensis TaxID=561372 RepID=A0A5J4ZLZ3_9ASTE|nr:hypothetical protein F0562_015565 [Nyssa sinensis]